MTGFDPAKRALTLKNRGLDMAEAGRIFEGNTITVEDDRREYGETRYITAGKLDGRMGVWAYGRMGVWAYGCCGLDGAWHGSPHHQFEEGK